MKRSLVRPLLKSLAALALLGLPLALGAAEMKHLLVVTATKGFRHSSIPTAEKVIAELGKSSGAFDVEYCRGGPDGKDDAEVREKMSPENLKKFDGVVFANTTGDLAIPDKEAFLAWLKSGKAFIGMHAASDTLHGYRPYIDMLPIPSNIQDASTLASSDKGDKATAVLDLQLERNLFEIRCYEHITSMLIYPAAILSVGWRFEEKDVRRRSPHPVIQKQDGEPVWQAGPS